MEHVKIVFEIPQDEDGYPPSAIERLWAIQQEDPRAFVLDNIPFYAKGVSSGDLVQAARGDGQELMFHALLEPSGNSTFRLYVTNEESVQQIRDDLREMGCPSELSNVPNLIAVEVPSGRPITPFLDYIVSANEAGILEYEEGAFRHDPPA